MASASIGFLLGVCLVSPCGAVGPYRPSSRASPAAPGFGQGANSPRTPSAPAASQGPVSLGLPVIGGLFPTSFPAPISAYLGQAPAPGPPPLVTLANLSGGLGDPKAPEGPGLLPRAFDGADGASALGAPSSPQPVDAGQGFAADPPFYGRQAFSPERPKTRKHAPTTEETERMRREYLKIGAAREEAFNAPSWFERKEFPELKTALFAVAVLDEALTDIANGEAADIPADLQGDVISGLLERRQGLWRACRAELERIRALPQTPAQKQARELIEHYHAQGWASPALETAEAVRRGAPYRGLAALYQQIYSIAAGRKPGSLGRVESLARHYARALRESFILQQARSVDALIALGALRKATPAEAKALYDRSVAQAKEISPANLEHLGARTLAARSGTLRPAPNLGKQLRPTCTVHMLRSLLAALGLRRSLEALVLEARALLDDPYVGMTTAFNLEQQVRLFKHYGRLALVRGRLLENLVALRRNLKVGIEIGDSVYKHSLILEGFYPVGGVYYVALRDSTSYFPTRMAAEDFGRVLTADAAVMFLEVYDRPRP